MALSSWDDDVCAPRCFYSVEMDDIDRSIYADYADVCSKLYTSSPMTPFEARMRAWAHLIRKELDAI